MPPGYPRDMNHNDLWRNRACAGPVLASQFPDLGFPATKTRYRKLSTSGPLSARSSRQAGLLARSHTMSSYVTFAAPALSLTRASMDEMLGAMYDIPLAVPEQVASGGNTAGTAAS